MKFKIKLISLLLAADWDTNGLYSYGLFMWNGPRYERLKKWCGENKLDYTTVNGQMNYLRHELEGSECETLAAMRAIPDTFEGCVDATVLFAELFERCASFSYGLRVYYAVNTFWPSYGTCAPSEKRGIYGVYCNYPVTVKTGDSYTLKGAVVSFTSPLTELSAGVYDANGKMLTGSTAYPSEYVYDITKIDRFQLRRSVYRGRTRIHGRRRNDFRQISADHGRVRAVRIRSVLSRREIHRYAARGRLGARRDRLRAVARAVPRHFRDDFRA